MERHRKTHLSSSVLTPKWKFGKVINSFSTSISSTLAIRRHLKALCTFETKHILSFYVPPHRPLITYFSNPNCFPCFRPGLHSPQESMESLYKRLERSRQMQTVLRAFEARDRNLLEDNLWKVSFWSCASVVVMLCVALTQVNISL